MAATILPMGYLKFRELLTRIDKPEDIDQSQCFEVIGDHMYFYNWSTATWWCWRSADNHCQEL